MTANEETKMAQMVDRYERKIKELEESLIVFNRIKSFFSIENIYHIQVQNQPHGARIYDGGPAAFIYEMNLEAMRHEGTT
jgi:hypothetical protein